MILTSDELDLYEKKVVMVDGCFDPVHIGHIRYFECASKQGHELLCNVQSDDYIRSTKQRPTLLSEIQRLALIDALKSVSYVHLCTTSTADVLDRLKPVAYVKGLDWKERGLPPKEKEVCKKHNIEIVYLDTNIDTSTNIVETFLEQTGNKTDLFIDHILSQKTVDASHYNDNYFQGDWRSGDNDYSIERRRKIEAKNPQNIKDVFSPKSILDVGCGPGALMYLLMELGIDSYGIDFSVAAKQIAPEKIRENIVVNPVTEFHDFDKNFDLVICRELLEHLTILEIKKTVAILAKYTSKYLYVTTRFCKSSSRLLDVIDDIDTDPTHITLLNKDFLKILFVLEGLKPRYDLEKKMDWKNYGRVMVFEKVN